VSVMVGQRSMVKHFFSNPRGRGLHTVTNSSRFLLPQTRPPDFWIPVWGQAEQLHSVVLNLRWSDLPMDPFSGEGCS
jgi:hypothetical protein